MTRYYQIGDVVLAIENPEGLEEGPAWSGFSRPACFPTVSVHVSYVDPIPVPPNAVRKGDICVLSSDRYHLSSDTGLPYARVHDHGAQLYIEIDRARLPFGKRTEHLFALLVLPHLLLGYQQLLLHGAYISFQNQGILFTGPSGIGKTTQAQLWHRIYGSESINEDRCVVVPSASGAQICGVPVAGSSPVCKNVTLPLRAIVVLSQGAEDRLELLRPGTAVARLMEGTYQLPAFAGDVAAACGLCAELAAQVPIYHLSCRPDAGAVQLLHRALFEGMEGSYGT